MTEAILIAYPDTSGLDDPAPSQMRIRGDACEVMIAECDVCSIVFFMKKLNPTKLTVRRETLRALASIELSFVAGGDVNTLWTGAVLCPALAESGAAACPALDVIVLPRG